MTQTILVQENDVVVGMDLVQTIQDAVSEARVILCHGLDDVKTKIGDADNLTVLILHQTAQSLLDSGLAALMHKSGARVFLTAAEDHEQDSMAAAGWFALQMPFTARDVLAALYQSAE